MNPLILKSVYRYRKLEKEENMDELNDNQRKLVEDNLPLTTYAIIKLHYKPTDEAYSDAYYGLCKAAAMYDESKGFKFNTYAFQCIRAELARSIRDKNAGRRIPEYEIISLDYEYSDDNDAGVRTLEDIISKDLSNNLEEKVIFMDICDRLNSYLNEKQSIRNKQIFLEHLNGSKQNELAEEYHLAQPTISRIIRKIQKDFKIKYYNNY